MTVHLAYTVTNLEDDMDMAQYSEAILTCLPFIVGVLKMITGYQHVCRLL